MSISFGVEIANPQHDAIIGLLGTVAGQSNADIAQVIENAALSGNPAYRVHVTWGLHGPNKTWFTIVLHNGDEDPGEMHIYVTYIEIPAKGGDSDSEDEGEGHLELDLTAGLNKPDGCAFSTPAHDGTNSIGWA